MIYPPALQRALKGAGEDFRECCPKADDIWLHVVTIRSGFQVRQVGEKSVAYPSLPGSSRSALMRLNVDSGQNDVQAARTYTPSDLALLD